MSNLTVYVSIGNSDDKLAQAEWAEYVETVHYTMRNLAYTQHGPWFSAPDSKYQNACWCVEVREVMVDRLKSRLAEVAKTYRQDSIAWAPAVTEFITAGQ